MIFSKIGQKEEMVKKMDEIDVLNNALKEYEYARRLKRINQVLYDHLAGSIYYLLKYSERYNITLPKKWELVDMIEKSHFYIDQIAKPATENLHKEDQSESGQSPIKKIHKYNL